MKERKLPYGEISRLAHLSGYTPMMISKMLSGERRGWWKSEKLEKLCSATGTKINLWRYGAPEEIIKANTSYTAKYLKEKLKSEKRKRRA